MLDLEFATSAQAHAFSNEVSREMADRFGMTRTEAVTRVNKVLAHQTFVTNHTARLLGYDGTTVWANYLYETRQQAVDAARPEEVFITPAVESALQCMERVAQEMTREFGISLREATGRINQELSAQFLISDDGAGLFTHTEESLPGDIYYGHASLWWTLDELPPPLFYPRSMPGG